MPKLSIRDLDVRGKRVLMRVDFNVPVEERAGQNDITDDTRIREALPTINYLREHKAKTILMSHFGRPKGKRVPKYSLRPVGEHLHTLIAQAVMFSHDTIGEVPQKIVAEADIAMRAFDQTGNVRDRRSTVSQKLNHTDNRMQGRERIRRHFRPRRRNSPKQSRLPSIRIADQSRVCDCS